MHCLLTTSVSISLQCSSHARGTFTPAQIADNVTAAAAAIIKHISQGWKGIRALYIKTASSVALPIYTALPEAAAAPDAIAAVESDSETDVSDAEGELAAGAAQDSGSDSADSDDSGSGDEDDDDEEEGSEEESDSMESD